MTTVPPTSELSPLQRAFLALERAEARAAQAEAAGREPIAIVGLACRVPGAPDAQAFWELLRDGIDAVGPVPAGRFDLDAVHDPLGERPGHSLTREAGFLPDVAGFDPEFFGITRREAHGMDPQQRLLLEVSWQALEHAAQPPDRLSQSSTGVYVGLCSNDYGNLLVRQGDPALFDAHYTSGNAHSVASGRVSYLLGLQGPAVTVDTACSSSLVAVHLACQALRAGDCRMALAGGVNVMLSPDLFIAFSNTRMLARDGRCKTFDAAADGFGRGEGCAVVVLKRLSDALADADRVLAVIRGSAVNQDGPSSGLTAPNGPAQEAVIREALDRAGLSPHQVGLIEAHGTGTELGDPLEVQALGHVFGPGRDPSRPLWLGSVKTNLGHLEAAAGVTGLVKLVLALQHGQVPPHLHWHTPSPHIPWASLPVRVPTRLTPWEPIDGRRIGGVSSFGFSGTNAHIVVEAFAAPEPARAAAAPTQAGASQLFVLSARDARALAELAQRHAHAFDGLSDADLADVCHTAAVARARLPERAAIRVASMAALREALQSLAAGSPDPRVQVRRVARRDPPRVLFLFTGQGSQYVGMARGLHARSPVFRETLARCAAVLDPVLGRPLEPLLFDEAGPSDRLDATAFTQPALFAVEVALASVWQAWGVAPDALLGHSVGELAAACVAGVMPLEDGLRLVAERGRLMQSLPSGGAMAALQAGEAEVTALLHDTSGQVGIAAFNGPGQTVIAGPADEVDRLCAAWAARGGRAQRLAVSHAFHSPLVEPILDAFERVAAGITLQRPQLRLVSNLTGQWARAEDVTRPGYWRRHVREPVRFAQGLATALSRAPDVLLEIGPQPALLALVPPAGTADDHPAVAPLRVPSLRRGRSDAEQIDDALASLFLAGVDIDWRAVWAGRGARIVDLPGYPFQHERCWFTATARPAAAVPASAAARPTGHPLLGARLRSAVPGVAVFDAELDAARLPWLRDHRVGGRAILPATGFIELALAAAQATGRLPGVAGLVIAEPLAVAEGETRVIQVLVRTDGAADGPGIEVLSLDGDGDTWRRHAQGRLVPQPLGDEGPGLAALRAACDRPVDVAEHRARLMQRGLDFGPSLLGLAALWCGAPQADAGQALGEVVLPEAADHAGYLLHPALLDACLQVMAAAVPDDGRGPRTYLPLAFDGIAWHRTPGTRVWSHATVRRIPGGAGDTLSADLRVFDDAGPVARLQGITLRPAAPAPVADPALYQVDWLPDPGAAWLPAPHELAARMGGRLEALAQAEDLAAHHQAGQALETLAAHWIIRVLTALGWQPVPGERVVAEALAGHLGVAPRHHRLLARYLDILAEDGWLVTDGAGWVVRRALVAGDPAPATAALAERHPASRARTALVAECGPALPGVLRGETDPLQLLFPDGRSDRAEALYRDTPEARVYNPFLRDAVLAALADRPADRPLRILEVGGGTGGTTAWLAPALPPGATDYLFTDLGATLVARARERFAAHRFMRFAVLDLEQDLAAQGLGEQRFDLVVAANVIHATADLRRTLAALRGVLAPGGQLLMMEVTGAERWIDLSFGLTEGWWRFTDTDLRPRQPLLSRAQWLALLAQRGFEACALDPADARSSEVVLAARRPLHDPAPAADGGRWLVVPDAGGVAQAWAAQAGPHVRCAPPGRDPDVLGQWLSAEAGAAGGLPVRGVLYLAGLDVPRLDDADPAAAAGGQAMALAPLLAVVQALGRMVSDAGPAPRLWVATAGAQPVAHWRGLAVAQAPLAGLCRVIEREHPEWRTTCVDLDPADAPAQQAHALAVLLGAADDERQLAWRGGRRWVARLVPADAGSGDDVAPARLEAGGTGVIDDLHLVPQARRAPGPGQVEIRMLAAGLNFRDVMNVVALRADPEPLGGECAGRIVAVGEGVSGLAVGDEVVATAPACFATHVLAEAADVALLPRGIGHAQAASVPFAFMTAWHALHGLAGLRAGQTVLIHAAAGGVGSAAVQLARAAGATVIATAGSEAKRAWLRAQGVAHVLHSRTLDFTAEVLALTDGRGVDVVLNSLAGDFIGASVGCLSERGCFLEIGKRDIWSPQRFHAERPAAAYHAIDLAALRYQDPAASRALFTRVIDDLRAGRIRPLPLQLFPLEQAAEAVRCMAQARHIGKVVLTGGPAERADLSRLDPEGSYLVTGGLGGLGLLTARHLVERGARHLLLVGRRPPAEPAAQELDRWRAAGVQVETCQADLADPQAVARVIGHADRHLPPLRGLVHSAGLLEDGALVQQDWPRFARPLGPKVDGAWALHVLTRGRALDFFVLYSSVAGTLGSAGQGNHAAANAFLDALAAHRRAAGLPAVSLAWGAWTGVGAAVERQVDRQAAERGIGTISPTRGLAWLDRLVAAARPHVVVCPVDWDRLLAGRDAAGVGRFLERVRPAPGRGHRPDGVATVPAAAPAPEAASDAAGDLVRRLREASPARRLELLQSHVGEQVARVIQAPDPRAIDLRQPLHELGLDSLMAVDLRNRLGASLGLAGSLPATLVFDHPTIEALSTWLLDRLSPPRTAPDVPAPAAVRPASAAPRSDAVGTIDDMSDAEVEALLARRMRRP